MIRAVTAPCASEGAVARLFARSDAARWGLTREAFAAAVQRSVVKRFADAASPTPVVVDAFVESLHAEDLGLACACADGLSEAWDHFVRTFRPDLYRAARTLGDEATARELADSLYADLFGLAVKDGVRTSLFLYYHGRAKLSTWLRSVLAQRRVDLARTERKTVSIDGDDASADRVLPPAPPDDPSRRQVMRAAAAAVTAAVATLEPSDRLRLAYYYVHELTLAQIGRLSGEHEATVSRKLDRTRRALRAAIEARLAADGIAARDVEDWADVARSAWDAALADALGVAPQERPVPPFKEERRT